MPLPLTALLIGLIDLSRASESEGRVPQKTKTSSQT